MRPAPPVVHAVPIQDSPVVVRISLRPHIRRLVCSVDGHRARTCTRTTRLKLPPGRHTVVVWAVGQGGRASAKRRVKLVVPEPAPRAVAIGGDPVGIAADGATLWISGGSVGSVVRFDSTTRTVAAQIPVGGQLGGIAATHGAVWVSGYGDGTVARIDPATNSVTAHITVGGRPTSIASDASCVVWVGNLDGWASRSDPATNQVRTKVTLPGRGSGISYANGLVWVSDWDDAYVVELNTATGALVGAVHTGTRPRESVVLGNTLWVLDEAVGRLTPVRVG